MSSRLEMPCTRRLFPLRGALLAALLALPVSALTPAPASPTTAGPEALPSAVQDDDAELAAWLQEERLEAQRLIDAADFGAAKRLLDEHLDEDPADWRARALRGRLELARARYDRAARDLDQALQDFGEYVDITRDDLERLIHHTERYALRRRMGELTAARIMSRDVQTASTETFIDDAWKQLQEHRLKALPVLDEHRRLAGIVTQSDLLKHFRPDGSPFKRLRFLRGTKLKTIMTTPVVCVQADTHAVELVSLLSDEGLHCLPVLNEAGYLVGIVSQTDLIAALYRNWLQHLGQADQIT